MANPSRSVRLKTIPVLAGAGTKRKFTFTPVCKPIPERPPGALRVCCWPESLPSATFGSEPRSARVVCIANQSYSQSNTSRCKSQINEFCGKNATYYETIVGSFLSSGPCLAAVTHKRKLQARARTNRFSPNLNLVSSLHYANRAGLSTIYDRRDPHLGLKGCCRMPTPSHVRSSALPCLAATGGPKYYTMGDRS